ncbi:MAG: flagellar hook-associated protein FlgK [Thermoanaerobacterales bacterium]|nr:flagellar hook-associated protein FlgK [Thermoanaerobacterales bacterium]
MLSTFFGLEIARRGLMAQRAAMDTTSHNIANANTEGYTRQQAVHTAENPYTIPMMTQKVTPGQLGTGVTVSEIRRVRDSIIDSHVRWALGDAGYWEERSDALARVEALFPEPTDYGLQSVIGKFFNYWQDLNNNPQDPGLKAAVREAGEELTSMVKVTYGQLVDNRDGLENDLENKVDEINNLADQIAAINQAIASLGNADYKANDLMDRRDVLLDKLAAIGEIQVTSLADGQVEVRLFGEVLINGTNPPANVTGDFPLNGGSPFTVTIGTSPAVNVTTLADANAPGSLVGLESARQKVIGYINNLNELAQALITQVNAKHPDNGTTRADFFAGTDASSFSVHPDIILDVTKIDGTLALDVAGLRDDAIAALGDTTFEGFYTQLVTRIGTDVSGAADRVKSAQAVREQLQNLRQSVIGVSIDEELANLTQYQYAYQASARVVTVLDAMLDTIINRMGV